MNSSSSLPSSSLPSSSLSFPSQGLPQHHSSSGCNLTDKLLFFNSLKSFLMKQNTHVKKKTSEVKIEFIQLSIKKKVYCQGSATLKINRPMPRCSCSLILHRDAAWRRIVLTLGRRMQGAASLQHLRPPSSAFARLGTHLRDGRLLERQVGGRMGWPQDGMSGIIPTVLILRGSHAPRRSLKVTAAAAGRCPARRSTASKRECKTGD